MSKYDPLFLFLSKQKDAHISLSLKEIESIIGNKLPDSAYTYAAWWSNSRTTAHTYSRAWTNAGYLTTDVISTLYQKRINFIKE